MAGGLGQYLGVDSTVLRVGFVIASLLFLGGFGGPVLYVIAWILVPEEGKDAPFTKATFSGRPWHDWDRSARSWALVLGALALALIWSFGVWPWWHWRVLPFWLVALALVLWLLARHRDNNWTSSAPAQPPAWGGPAGPGQTPGGGPGSGPGPANGGGPNGPAPGTGQPVTGQPVTGPYVPAPEAGPQIPEPYAPLPETPAAAAASAVTMTAPIAADAVALADPASSGPLGQPESADEDGTGNGSAAADGDSSTNGRRGAGGSEGHGAPLAGAAPVGGLPVASPSAALATATLAPAAHNGSADPNEQSDADWVAARSAAADWAAGQLALAGVPSKSGPGSSAPAGVTTKGGLPASTARGLRRLVRVLLALLAALVLLAVLTVVGVTLGTGSSLSGGAGDNTFAPASLAAVQSNYRLGAGRLNVNLAAVTFPTSGKTVNVTVGLGRLTVEVPRNTVINLQARTGLGQVNVFGQTGSNLQETYYTGTGAAPQNGAPHLNLNAHVGMGYLQILP